MFNDAIDFFAFLARILRILRLQSIVRRVRTRAGLTLFTQLHVGVVHKMRELAIRMKDLSPDRCDPHTEKLASDVMSGCRDLMADLLEVPDGVLHCCFKVIVHGGGGVDHVVTMARSTPQDSRHDDNDPIRSDHPVTKNSDWSALLGKDDGTTRWQRPFSCFICNDLQAQSKYVCSRNGWQNMYGATMALPLRFIRIPERNRYTTFGFIVFYSKRTGVFSDLPNIFDYIDQWDEYHAELERKTAFQVGAVLADSLSIALRPVYEQFLAQASGATVEHVGGSHVPSSPVRL